MKGRGLNRAREVVIITKEPTTAANVQSLIYGGILLMCGDNETTEPPSVQTIRSSRSGIFRARNDGKGVISVSKVPLANVLQYSSFVRFGCECAYRAWDDVAFRFAVERFKTSLGLCWLPPEAASPRYGRAYRHNSIYEWTRAALAIVAAYGAIEELGLGILGASKDTPRKLGDGWHPQVKEKTERELAALGVDVGAKVTWIMRGPCTHLQRELWPRTPARRADYSWLGYPIKAAVRDREVAVIDALQYCSWMRNCVAAHKFADCVNDISPYEVYNVQKLARDLLLTALDFSTCISMRRDDPLSGYLA